MFWKTTGNTNTLSNGITISEGNVRNFLTYRLMNSAARSGFLPFLGITKKYQNYLANAGGLALFADADAVANPASKVTADPFAAIVKKNALGMYPDWPVPGFYPILLQEGIKLLSDGDVAAYQKAVGDFYNAGKPKA